MKVQSSQPPGGAIGPSQWPSDSDSANPTFLHVHVLLSANFHVLPQTQCSVSTQWRYPKSGAACRQSNRSNRPARDGFPCRIPIDTETALNAESGEIPEILS